MRFAKHQILFNKKSKNRNKFQLSRCLTYELTRTWFQALSGLVLAYFRQSDIVL
jgi:outer membrane phospholipase A